MHKSCLIFYKHISIHSDGCLSVNYTNLNTLKQNKNLIIYNKDYIFILIIGITTLHQNGNQEPVS